MKINMSELLRDTYTEEKDFLTFVEKKTQLTKIRNSLIKKKTLLEKEREIFDKEKEKLAKERETFAKERESFTEAKKQLFKQLNIITKRSLNYELEIDDQLFKACDRLEDIEDEIQDKIDDREIPVIPVIEMKIKNIRSDIKALELFSDDIFKNDNKKEIVDKFKKLHL
jgi:ribosome-binding ATPase YchF (GTP1/OBG family)